MTKREFSSGGVIIKKTANDIKVLLIKDGYGRWTWPKGHIEKGETSKAAALREICEEVGLKNISTIEKISSIKYFYHLKDELIFKTVFIYLFEAVGNEALRVLRSEISAAKWLTPENALDKVEYEGSKEVLKKAIERFKRSNQ